MVNRREFLSMSGLALATTAAVTSSSKSFASSSTTTSSHPFKKGFLWGAASAGHQVEGNNINADIWLFENVQPSIFRERSGDACNSFELWETDLDLAKNLGLTAYRFSLEWARIEPTKGHFSNAMLDHYKRIIDGCHARGMTPVVTYNHFSSPIWFAAQGGWTNDEAPTLFARFCDVASKHLADGIGYALTFNEPNLFRLLTAIGLPEFVWQLQADMLTAAAKAVNSKKVVGLNALNREDFDLVTKNLLVGHKLGREAIKAVRPDLPVGFSLAVIDDRTVGTNSIRDKMREEHYGAWLRESHTDFIGVQNYERIDWDDKGPTSAPNNALKNSFGHWIDPTSLANCVTYIHKASGKPIIVTEHGVATDDDDLRCSFISSSIRELQTVIDQGVPVAGYIHWALLDNFEWINGFNTHLGLHSVDLETFERKPKNSAFVLGNIAKNNGL